MKNLVVTIFLLAFGLAGVIPEAEARRFGSGSSFGMQRQATPPAPRQPAAAQSPRPAQPAAATPGNRSWLGPVAGLAAGLGLAALFSHLGFGEEFGSFVLLALIAFAAVLLFRRFTRARTATAPLQYAAQGSAAGGAQGPAQWGAPRAPDPAAPAQTGTASSSIPADFDAESFARQAKVQFIRLQAAHDARDLDDIREYTTPEVFAEIRMQLSEAGAETTRTDVVDLAAEVVEVAEEAQRYIVSVRFHGLIREEAGADPAPFDEVWHLTKPRDGNRGWLIAGIQQVS